jgi:hypothetical protein
MNTSVIKSAYVKYKSELVVVLGLYLLWKFRGLLNLFGTVTDAAGASVSGAVASMAERGKRSAQRAKLRTTNSAASDADLGVFDRDAAALASFLGKLPGSYSNWLYPDRAGALGIAKRYSRLFVRDGKVVYDVVGGKRVPLTRKDSLRLPVLEPFYNAVTAGRSLAADLDGAMRLRSDDIERYYTQYIK